RGRHGVVRVHVVRKAVEQHDRRATDVAVRLVRDLEGRRADREHGAHRMEVPGSLSTWAATATDHTRSCTLGALARRVRGRLAMRSYIEMFASPPAAAHTTSQEAPCSSSCGSTTSDRVSRPAG